LARDVHPQSAPPGAAPLEIQAESLGRISGRAILRDLSGAPSLLLETSIARRILANGISGQFFLTGWILLSGAAIGLFAFWLVDRWVLQHLSNSVEALKQGVSAVTARANLKLRLKTMQEGEMKELANCLNDMLNALDQAQQASESRRRDLIQAQKMTALGTLVAGVAHEVNNPNTVVGLNLTALQRRLDKALAAETPPAEREALKADITALLAETRDATRRIAAIAASLKGFARPASEKMDALIAVNGLIRNTSELLKHTLAKANCTLTASLADPSPTLLGNEQQLSQVLINLVENACQASPESGGPIVIVSEKGTDGGARVTVRDQGRGILPEHLDRIFEPFFTTRRSQGGTGLGLAISREIIQAHGGTISIRSVPDEGSEFIVDFPPPVRKEVS
jgi:signal transduction histidine kinase